MTKLIWIADIKRHIGKQGNDIIFGNYLETVIDKTADIFYDETQITSNVEAEYSTQTYDLLITMFPNFIKLKSGKTDSFCALFGLRSEKI